MKIKFFAVVLSLVAAGFLAGGCCLTKCCSASKSVELFNGKDLEAWNYVLLDPQVKKEAVWSVKDGMIICQGSPVGFIYTGEKVTNFRLVVEYRWAPGSKPGNSGIFSRIHEPLKALPATVETQLQHGNAGDVLTLQGMKIAASQPRYFFVSKHALGGDICGVKKTADKEKTGGEWNRVEILAAGDRYTVWMNGEKINEVTGVEVCAGQIGLQSEGGEVHFRRATLTPM